MNSSTGRKEVLRSQKLPYMALAKTILRNFHNIKRKSTKDSCKHLGGLCFNSNYCKPVYFHV